jgi:RsiW-degrading membrane proteinase PrsW (M82 family)
MASSPRPGPVTRGLKVPNWGPKLSLFQWREPAFWAFLVLMLVCGVIAGLWMLSLLVSSPGGFVLSWFLLLFYLLPMFLIIYFLDFYDREPLSLVFAALAWGMIAATSLSAGGNDQWGAVIARLAGPDFATTWSAALTAPIIEESFKGVGVVLIYLIARREVNDIMDGFVYGAMIGLGFTVVEDVTYFIGAFGGTVGGIIQGFFFRVVVSGLYGHVIYTGLVGMGIAYFTTRKGEVSDGKRWLVTLGLIAAPVFAHFLWDSPLLNLIPPEGTSPGLGILLLILTAAIKGVPFLAFLVMMLVLARRRERYWLRKSIEAELGGPGLQPGELPILMSGKARRHSRDELRQRSGAVAAGLLGQIQKEQIKLAMVRTRASGPDHPDLLRQRARLQDLRNQLAMVTSGRPPAGQFGPGGPGGFGPGPGGPPAASPYR